MTAKYKFLIVSIIFLGLVSFIPSSVKAQDEVVNSEANQVLTESAGLDNELEPLDGVQINEVEGIPSNFGFWWRNVREWVSVALTLDPVAKAEKQLKFAEERTRLADYIIQNSEDLKVQERAQEMLEKANQYMQNIESRKDDLIERADEKSQKLLNNVAKHYLNKERVLEKIEDKIPPEKLEKFQQLRQVAEEKCRDFLEGLENNSDIPQEIQENIKNILLQAENTQKIREEFRSQQKGILEEIKAGNEEAKKQFEELRQERKENTEQVIEQFKNQKQEIINKIQEGDQEAVIELKQLNREQQMETERIRNVIKEKTTDFKQEIQQQKQEVLQKMQENQEQLKTQIKNNNPSNN